MGLVRSRQEHGNKRKGQMIWDAIDMIMPLRGLLALSCLDLSWETYMLYNVSRVGSSSLVDNIQNDQFNRISKRHVH